MFLTSKTIDIFHTQTIDVPTLGTAWGVVRLRGCLYMTWGWGASIHPVLSAWVMMLELSIILLTCITSKVFLDYNG